MASFYYPSPIPHPTSKIFHSPLRQFLPHYPLHNFSPLPRINTSVKHDFQNILFPIPLLCDHKLLLWLTQVIQLK